MPLDTDGLPKIDGLQDFVAQTAEPFTQDKVQELAPQFSEAPIDGQPPVDPGQGADDDLDLGVFKNTKEVLKSYKEIQGFTTRVSQENKELKDELARLKESLELNQFAAQQPRPPVQGQTFEEKFINNPQMAIHEEVQRQALTLRLKEVLDEESAKNPDEYRERVGYVQMLANDPKFAPLSFSPQGVRKLFEIADNQRKTSLQRQAQKALNVLFGDDIDVDKFKALIKKDQAQTNQTINPQTGNPPNMNAFMPEVTTSTRTGQTDTRLAELQKAKEKALQNGDPRAMAGALIQEALLKQ